MPCAMGIVYKCFSIRMPLFSNKISNVYINSKNVHLDYNTQRGGFAILDKYNNVTSINSIFGKHFLSDHLPIEDRVVIKFII